MVVDSGPLIGLSRIGSLELIRSVFDPILIPETVAGECCRDLQLPGARVIHTAIGDRWLRVAERPRKSGLVFLPSLGAGERSAIEIATARRLGVLMDDRPGRLAAKQAGVPVLGTGGLLLLAKQRGVVDRIEPLLSGLRRQGYHLSSALVADLLRRAGETV